MKALFTVFVMNASFYSPYVLAAPEVTYTISNTAFGSPLTMTASKNKFAGAIYSITWNGKQFLNADDHGRELQSASQFDGLGECFNPTEAGSLRDAAGLISTSVLLQVAVTAHRLKTTSKMAFWTPVGYTGTGANNVICSAANLTDLSNHTFSKQVTVGIFAQNIIEYLATFHVAEGHSAATFEGVTGYLTSEFSSFWSFDPRNGALTALVLPNTGVVGGSNLPLIFSTQDKNFAMGIYAPDFPLTSAANQYFYFNFANAGNTMKWSAAYPVAPAPIGDYSFRGYVAVGTLDQVKAGLTTSYTATNAPSGQTNIYRFYNATSGEHFFSSAALEGVNAGFIAEAVGFRVLSSPGTQGTVALYRCNSGFHFVSTSTSCEGATKEGTYGYAYVAQQAASVPLYRFYKSSTGDRLATTFYNEGLTSGYTYEGVLGYVPSF